MSFTIVDKNEVSTGKVLNAGLSIVGGLRLDELGNFRQSLAENNNTIDERIRIISITRIY